MRAILYLLNHGDTLAEIALDAPCRDLITGQALERQLTLAPRGVAALVAARGGQG